MATVISINTDDTLAEIFKKLSIFRDNVVILVTWDCLKPGVNVVFIVVSFNHACQWSVICSIYWSHATENIFALGKILMFEN